MVVQVRRFCERGQLVVVDDLAEICDTGPRTHTMNASRERGFFCWFSFSFFCLVFPDLNLVYKLEVTRIARRANRAKKKKIGGREVRKAGVCCSLKHAEISISGGESHSKVVYLQRGSQWEWKETRIQQEKLDVQRRREGGGLGIRVEGESVW